MAMLKKAALLIEIVILCGPAAALLAAGCLYLPAAVSFSFRDSHFLYFVALIILGISGFIALGSLALHVIFNAQWWPGNQAQRVGIISGITASLIGLSTLGENHIIAAIFISPVFATAHLLHLSRKRDISKA